MLKILIWRAYGNLNAMGTLTSIYCLIVAVKFSEKFLVQSAPEASISRNLSIQSQILVVFLQRKVIIDDHS